MKNNLLFPISVNTISGIKWGYINAKGEVVISPVYDMAYDFQDIGCLLAVAVIRFKGSYGIIKENGEYLVAPTYEKIDRYYEKRAVAYKDGKVHVIDECGSVIKITEYNHISSYKNSVAIYTDKDGMKGFIDLDGSVIDASKYEEILVGDNGSYTIKVADNNYIIVNECKEVVKSLQYAYVGKISEDRIPYKENIGGKYGYLNSQGEECIYPQYVEAGRFLNGRAVVISSEYYINSSGLIDESGRLIYQNVYNDILLLGENVVALGMAIDKAKVYLGSKYAIGDIQGNIFSDYMYLGISNFDGGYASAYDEKNTFFINRVGKVGAAFPIVQGKGRSDIIGGMVRYKVDNKILYYDKNGEIVWVENRSIRLNDKYSIKEMKYRPNINYLVYYPKIVGVEDKEIERSINDKLKQKICGGNISHNARLDYNYYSDYKIEIFDNNTLVIKVSSLRTLFSNAKCTKQSFDITVNLENDNL